MIFARHDGLCFTTYTPQIAQSRRPTPIALNPSCVLHVAANRSGTGGQRCACGAVEQGGMGWDRIGGCGRFFSERSSEEEAAILPLATAMPVSRPLAHPVCLMIDPCCSPPVGPAQIPSWFLPYLLPGSPSPRLVRGLVLRARRLRAAVVIDPLFAFDSSSFKLFPSLFHLSFLSPSSLSSPSRLNSLASRSHPDCRYRPRASPVRLQLVSSTLQYRKVFELDSSSSAHDAFGEEVVRDREVPNRRARHWESSSPRQLRPTGRLLSPVFDINNLLG